MASCVRPQAGATVHVYLEETSVADAPANRLAETQLTLDQHPPRPDGWTVLAFALRPDGELPPITPSASYTVRVWVDADSDGRMGPNDLFSDQAYPVLTHGFGNQVDVLLTSL